MKYPLVVLFSLLSLSIVAQTTSTQVSPPLAEAMATSVGMSPERLSRIDAMLKEAVENDDIPGAVAFISRRGKIVFLRHTG